MSTEYVEFQAKCVKETERALLCTIEDGETPEWIPKSQLGEQSTIVGEGDVGVLSLPEWLAIERGLL